jgi:hypothetical protein
MNLAAAYMFGRKQGDLLQDIRDSCTFYADFNSWSLNVFTPQVGVGTLNRPNNNSVSGQFGLGVGNFDLTNKLITSNKTLNNSSILKPQNDFYISFFLNRTDTTSSYIFSMGEASNSLNYYVNVFGSKIVFGLVQNINGNSSNSTGLAYDIPSGNSIIQLYRDKDDDSFHCYVNGVKKTVQDSFAGGVDISGEYPSGNPLLRIGMDFSNNRKLPATIDTLCFFEAKLTQEIVNIHYNNGNGVQLF